MRAFQPLVLLIVVLSVASCSEHDARKKHAPSEAYDAHEEIAAVFQEYRRALLANDGQAAWSVIDSHSQDYYAEALRDALSMPRADLDRLDLLHKFMVLRFRQEFRKPQLQQLTGREVFVLGVTNGWISKSTVQEIKTLHRVTVDDRYAAAYLQEAPTVPAFHFIREGTEWKLSLWRNFELANAAMDQARRQSSLSERDFVIELLKNVSKYAVDERIFDRPLD
jgi:hypothetical protein